MVTDGVKREHVSRYLGYGAGDGTWCFRFHYE